MLRAGLMGLMIVGLSLGCDDGGAVTDAGGMGGGQGGAGGGQGGAGGGQGGAGGGQGGMGGGQGGMGGGQGGMGGGQGGMGGGQGGMGGIGNESTDALCSNGVDDDGDGQVDCADRHCLANPAVSVCPGMRENSDATCDDGVDNDGNGHTDCGDFSCSQNPWVTVCGPHEASDEACSDGIDNDGNNFVDCDDFGCSRNSLVGVCSQSEAGFCIDGRDNDGDGDIDCDDSDCAGIECGGGQGGMGGGGQGGMGGGGCTPNCSQSECGPDGCGGTCGPGCGGGQLCTNGRCQAGECGQGTFECSGECVDLVEDLRHCGSCGTSCLDEWPAALNQAGISEQASGMTPACNQAECQFDCPGAPGLDPTVLLDSLAHCGGCNQRCSHDLPGNPESACSGGACQCLVDGALAGAGRRPIPGSVCGGYCMYDGDNCNGACCPQLARRQEGQIRETGYHSYRFTVDAIGESRFSLNSPSCRAAYLNIIEYGPNGATTVQHIEPSDCVFIFIASPGTQYAAHILTIDAMQYEFEYEHTPYPVFTVPGQIQVQAVDNEALVLLDVQRTDDFAFSISGGTRCEGNLDVSIDDLEYQGVWGDRYPDCLPLQVDQPAIIPLRQGKYLMQIDAPTFEGSYRLRAQ